MLLPAYCHKKGMTVDQYYSTKKAVCDQAKETVKKARSIRKPDTGVYWPIEDIKVESEFWPFVVQELKKLGVEFIDNETYYRI